jgi:hypothetical protein
MELTVYITQSQHHSQLLKDRYGGHRNSERWEEIWLGRIRHIRLLKHVLNTHMEEADYETLLKE